MGDLEPGLYEALITDRLRKRLDALGDPGVIGQRELRSAEAADRIAWHLSSQVQRALEDLREEDRVAVGIDVARSILTHLSELLPTDRDEQPATPATVLHSIVDRAPDGSPRVINEPLTPLLDTTLLTNAPGDPTLWSQLRSEVDSADAIDVVMAFIRRSGIAPLLPSLRRHCEAGRSLRILTTTYTGSTERRALDLLTDLGADIRISYDVSTTRLHAKAWLFRRRSGISTAYIGSSNLTHSAQVTGLEWNVRASAARNRAVLDRVIAVFESYWAGNDFVPYDVDQFDQETARVLRSDSGPTVILSPIELRPLPFQERLLELLALARLQGAHRNLLVSATGTGKTVMAALDYERLRQASPRARLLFIAHREEILDQSMATFRYALRDASFGEKWVGGSRPTEFEHVFASIQSLDANGLESMEPDHFDVVMVDEFHHAAASSYTRIIERLHPRELLGLTATPERSDGLPILQWFGGKIAAELRLWDAIDQQLLAPFTYFGIHDGLDLRELPWKRGQGYELAALTNTYTSNSAWVRLVIQNVAMHADTATMRCLGFCVSVEHARFMAEHFRRAGIPAAAIWGDTPRSEREGALRDLASGAVRALFSVDLFNEGIDLPAVDTVLMLRPTESPTLFLQQLGRGLRRAPDKGACVVLDFVGTHRREFRFDRRLRSLLGGSRRDVERAVENQFPFLPAGCHMQLDRQATEIVLRSLREAIPTRWPAKVDELRSLRRDGAALGLGQFLDESGLELTDVYDGRKSWSDLQQDAGVSMLSSGPEEVQMRRAIGRMLHVDDSERLDTYASLVGQKEAPTAASGDIRTRRLTRMLVASVCGGSLQRGMSVQQGLDLLWSHPQVRAELHELFTLLSDRVDHLHPAMAELPAAPLQIHARYTRIEILAAMGVGSGARVAPWQSGVYEAKEARADLLAFTLDKTSGGFSPTTRYRDYAITQRLIHWESQSSTRADGPTGLRYRHHETEGRTVLLFTRARADERSFWFLGPATYRAHEGERPMAITWELTHPLPGDLFALFAAAVA